MVDAREYHDETNHTLQQLRESSFRLDPETRPRPYKIYENLPRIDPDGDPDPPDTPVLTAIDTSSADPPAAVDELETGGPGDVSQSGDPDVPTLCHYATGVTKRLTKRGEEMRFRAAACTGKLYHVDLYAVTGECGSFDPGVYHFDPDSGGFDVLREGDYRGVLAAASGDHPGVAEAPVTFVATSEWWRNAWKYRERTYRHAFWDSGTILANLLATAHGAGHRAEVVMGFADDPVVDLLGVDPDEQAPLELVPVGSGAPVPDATAADPGGDRDRIDGDRGDGDRIDLDPIDPETVPPTDEDDVVEYTIVPDAWRQSRLDDGDAAREWRERFAAESPDDALTGLDRGVADRGEGDRSESDRIVLDPVDRETASARPVGATIERRGSLREYSHESISARKFATVLDRALGGVPVDTFGSSALRGLVDCYCLVHAVDGIEQGAYEYHPGDCTLERAGETDRETAVELALGQDVVGDAAVNVYLVADVDAVVERFGNRGYRLAQLEAGVALGRLYLATYAHRTLGGRGFTFFDERVTEHLSPDAANQRPMTLFAFGRPGES